MRIRIRLPRQTRKNNLWTQNPAIIEDLLVSLLLSCRTYMTDTFFFASTHVTFPLEIEWSSRLQVVQRQND